MSHLRKANFMQCLDPESTKATDIVSVQQAGQCIEEGERSQGGYPASFQTTIEEMRERYMIRRQFEKTNAFQRGASNKEPGDGIVGAKPREHY